METRGLSMYTGNCFFIERNCCLGFVYGAGRHPTFFAVLAKEFSFR